MKSVKIEPVDIVFFRGNHLFGGAGQHGDSLMPPWPSVFSGALRSMLISRDPGLWSGVHSGDGGLAGRLAQMLRVGFVTLVKGAEMFFQPPADLMFIKVQDSDAIKIVALKPHEIGAMRSSYDEALPMVLKPEPEEKGKPESGYWLKASGMKRWLNGELPGANDLVETSKLWKTDYRLGIALDAAKWSAREHAIYTSDAVVLTKDIGFLVGVDATGNPDLHGTIRLGGDGRAAQVRPWDQTPPWQDSDLLDRIAEAGRFKMILTTPGIFQNGWLPDFVTKQGEEYVFKYMGVTARLVTAKVGRFQVVSGWDLLRHEPKPAQRAVPAGSVYWFQVKGGHPEQVKAMLTGLLENGLWPDDLTDLQQARRAEGFNNVYFGVWK